jgi:hypothetical protein
MVAAVEYILHKHGAALAAGQSGHKNGLSVGGEAGVGGGTDGTDTVELAAAVQGDLVFLLGNPAAGLLQNGQHTGQVLRFQTSQLNAAACGGSRAQIGGSGHPVADDGVLHPVLRYAPLNTNAGGARAGDMYPGFPQKVL